jgi:hypothetical protein
MGGFNDMIDKVNRQAAGSNPDQNAIQRALALLVRYSPAMGGKSTTTTLKSG